jgi:proteasome lid subunit RPN8/RPN11
VKPIIVTQELWNHTWFGLRDRGKGRRETACIWGGHRVGPADSVQSVIFLDDLPGVRAGTRYHQMSRPTILALFKILRERREVIVADIHTHPEGWVDLSPTDTEHPIEFRPGLPALVIPHFAKTAPTAERLGLHEYLGEGAWRMLSAAEIRAVLGVVS